MSPVETFLLIVFIAEIIIIALILIFREFGTPQTYGLQKEVDLRLTYKRYVQIYPGTNVSYEQYKRMQAAQAYRKAVSSTKIKRMVR
jgi:hypothetical protein